MGVCLLEQQQIMKIDCCLEEAVQGNHKSGDLENLELAIRYRSDIDYAKMLLMAIIIM